MLNNMNLQPLSNSNINNEQQYCKGCEKTFPSSSFTINGKSYHTCNTCHTQNRANYQQKLMQQNNVDADQMLIEFTNFNDFMAEFFENKTNTDIENQENLEFKFSCIMNITILKDDFKERADHIIKVISDVDEYT